MTDGLDDNGGVIEVDTPADLQIPPAPPLPRGERPTVPGDNRSGSTEPAHLPGCCPACQPQADYEPEDPLNDWPVFLGAARARLDLGRIQYGNQSFQLPPGSLAAEMEEEALDIACWGFILWRRIRRLRELSRALEVAR